MLLLFLNKILPIRIDKEGEIAGLNIGEHGAKTEIFDLVNTIENQSRTKDLSIRVPVGPFTEVGQIAIKYNELMSNLENSLIAKTKHLNILDNVTEGLFPYR